MFPTLNDSIKTFPEDGNVLKMSGIKTAGLDSSRGLRISSNLIFIP